MSARLTRSVAATVAASALLGSAALAFPAAASAATAAKAPAPALRVTAAATAPGAHLQPGGSARTEIVKVSNTTGKAQRFQGELVANAGGVVYLLPGELSAHVTALGRTPATGSTFVSETPGYIGGFYPKGHAWGAFTIPAHATFSWKVTIAATKSFPLNDDAVRLRAGALLVGAKAPAFASVDYKVGSGHTGGRVDEKLVGDVELTAYHHPAFEFLTVTNHTGAALKQNWLMQPWIDQKPGTQLAVDVWVGSAAKGHWQPLTRDLNASGLANGASETFQLRVRVVSYTLKTPVQDQLEIVNWNGDVVPAPHIGLTVH